MTTTFDSGPTMRLPNMRGFIVMLVASAVACRLVLLERIVSGATGVTG
jgi:hypothetical protein